MQGLIRADMLTQRDPADPVVVAPLWTLCYDVSDVSQPAHAVWGQYGFQLPPSFTVLLLVRVSLRRTGDARRCLADLARSLC